MIKLSSYKLVQFLKKILTHKERKHQLSFVNSVLEIGYVSLDIRIKIYTKMCLLIVVRDQMLLRIVKYF